MTKIFGKLFHFGIRQAWASLFGGLLLGAIIITKYITLPGLSRYDWLFVIAVLIQIMMLVTKLEAPKEVLVILVFHLVGLGMELFKTSASVGSWSYPEQNIIRLGGVPLFSGFMYAAIGSYIARSWRVLHLEMVNYPKDVYTLILAIAIYINFFTHHYIFDFRYLIFAVLMALNYQTVVHYRIKTTMRKMHLLAGLFLISFFIWIAENIGTYTSTWLYPDQLSSWHIVSLTKLGSWLLLMYISFVMVKLLHNIKGENHARK
jgi:uncharacterized membrane protein YoaT (DUF817 family)